LQVREDVTLFGIFHDVVKALSVIEIAEHAQNVGVSTRQREKEEEENEQDKGKQSKRAGEDDIISQSEKVKRPQVSLDLDFTTNLLDNIFLHKTDE